MRDIDNISPEEVWDRIESWDNYHRDMVVWLFNHSDKELSKTEWAYQYAHFEIAVEINRENRIWDSAEVVRLDDYRK